MATTKLIQPHIHPALGMDSTTPPHLVPEGVWTMVRGMRSYHGKLVEFPRFIFEGVINVSAPVVETIYNLPTGVRSECLFVTFATGGGNQGVYQLRYPTSGSVRLARDDGLFPTFRADAGDAQIYNLFQGTIYSNQVWFTDPTTKLKYTDGTKVTEFGGPIQGNITGNAIITGDGPLILLLQTVRDRSIPTAPMTCRVDTAVTTPPQIGQTVIFRSATGIQFPRPGVYEFVVVARTVDTFTVNTNYTGLTVGGTIGSDFWQVKGSLQNTADFVTFTAINNVHNLRVTVGDVVRLSGFSKPHYNGLFEVTTVPTGNSFTFRPQINVDLTTDPVAGYCLSLTNDVDVPAGRYIVDYFDHLIIANCTFRGVFEPWHVRNSGLYEPWQFVEKAENEADFFEVNGWQRVNSCISGVTGIGKINDVLFIYTDSVILRYDYVGLPKVFQIRPAFEGFGNSFYYGLVVSRGLHFFYDCYHQNFFKFDGQNEPVPIGDPILGFFLPNVVFPFDSTDKTQETTAFCLPERQEAWWCFYAVQLADWYIIVYNWASNSWTILRSPLGRLKAIGGNGILAKTIDQLTGTTIDGLTGTPIDNLAKTDITLPRFFVFETSSGSAGTFYSETTTNGFNTGYVESPFLETKDFFVPDLQRLVDIDRICIHAKSDFGRINDAIDVYVSARNSLHDAVQYKLVGQWTKDTVDGIVNFPPIKGRIFRYKFQFTDKVPATLPLSVYGWVFFSFTDNVFNGGAER